MAGISTYYITNAEMTAMEYVTDYSAQGLASLAAAEERGAIIHAVHSDGREERVAASEVSDPNVAKTGTASIGVTYGATAQPGLRLMKAQGAERWTGTLAIGDVTLRFEDGLLASVSQTDGGNDEDTK